MRPSDLKFIAIIFTVVFVATEDIRIKDTMQEMIGGRGESPGKGSSSSSSSVGISIINFQYTKEGDDAFLYWEVDNGVGCCHTYSCDYILFYESCLYPDFRLYEVYLDGIQYLPNMSNYNYTCSNQTVWNNISYVNLSTGNHTFNIQQKECSDNVVLNTSYIVEV